MKVLLSILVLVLIVLQTLSIDASLAPGLSVKNALLYLAAVSIVVRLVFSGRVKPDMVGLQACFLFLIAYATVSWLIALLAIKYPNYEFLDSAIALKGSLYDYAIFFVVFFYGLQTLEDSLAVLDALLAGVVVANVITVLDASQLLGWNIIPVRTTDIYEMGRVQGAFGESNQHAAVVVLLLPAMFAKAITTRGVARMFWGVGALFGVAAVFMTASRGAMLGMALAAIWGAYIFRRFISLGKIAGWMGVITVVVSVVLVAMSATYTELLRDRVIGLSFGGDSFDASSGRTWIWATALQRMMESPWSFITGFGWDVYSSMGFEFAPHNTYLGLWFNLGLPGVIAFLLIIAQALFAGRAAAEVAPPDVRPHMVAFVIGFTAVCIAMFFVELHVPQLYVWAYVGLAMRAAASVRATASSKSATPERLSPASAVQGWKKAAKPGGSAGWVSRAP